jgi:acetylglutamate kinase
MQKEKLYVVKIGGKVINDEILLQSFLKKFASIEGKKILVHGGGKLLETLAAKLDVPQQMINGRRITDEETLKLAVMVYAGAINKNIVAQLQACGLNAIGLSGTDMDCIRAEKRRQMYSTPPIAIGMSGTTPMANEINFGFVGDIIPDGVNVKNISLLLENGIVPVFCSVTHDGKGQLLNTNADTLSNALAVSLSSNYDVQLHYCFEKKGILSNTNDDNSLIPEITSSSYSTLIQQKIISGGMIPKLDNAFEAIRNGVPVVVIAHSSQLINTIHKKENAGTYLIA